MFAGKSSVVVISEPDVQAALSHLRALPYRPTSPVAWDRQYLLGLVREAMPAKIKVGDLLEIGPGLYGIIKPFGVDLAGGPIAEGRLQVWIAVRSAGTDPSNICKI
jgi:hypothetical protein